MIQINRRYKRLRLREVYFSLDGLAHGGTDVVHLVQCPTRPGSTAQPFHTLIVDLEHSEDALLGGLSKNCRYEVKRAREKDGLTCHYNATPTASDIRAFCDFFSPFAKVSGIAPANEAKMTALNLVQALTITRIENMAGEILGQHVYLHDQVRTRLLYSATQFRDHRESAARAVIGRANRLLHWQDMLTFKSREYKLYDLGGIALTEAMAGIDRFKQEFGGTTVCEWNSMHGVTIIGKLGLALVALKERWSTRRLKNATNRLSNSRQGGATTLETEASTKSAQI